MRNLLILLTLVLVACGPDGKHFAIDGRLLNLNQGEFVVYSPDGAMEGVDTIFVEGGRFDYVGSCIHEGTAVVVLPNGQDIPVFIAPGKTFSISGDAQNLKAIKVDGGDENKLMNAFRKDIESKAKDESYTKEVQNIVENNPTSAVSKYLVRRYLIDSTTPDYAVASTLVGKMLKADAEDAALQILQKRTALLKSSAKGSQLPAFSLTDINGNTVSNGTMSSGIWIICTIATWDFDSLNQMRRIKSLKTDNKANWNILALSFDASKKRVDDTMSFEMSDYTVICDEKMTETPLAEKLSLPRTGMAIVVKNGVITERSLTGEDLYKYLREKLN